MRAILKTIAISAVLILLTSLQPASTVSMTSASGELPGSLLEMKVSEFIKLSVKEFNTFAGKKMNLKERISFSLLKNDMKKSLKAKPDQLVKDYLASTDKKENATLIIIIIAVVVIAIIAVIVASSIGPGSINWGG